MTDTLCDCGRPTAGAILCQPCKTTLAHALVNIGIYWLDLDTVAAKHTRYGSTATKSSIGKEQPLPVDMRFINQPDPKAGEATTRRSAKLAPASQLKWDTWQTLVRWCRPVLAGMPVLVGPTCHACDHATCVNLRRRRRVVRNVPGMINFLARQHDWVTSQDWAPKLLEELLALERRLTRLIDRPADRWYAGKCSARRDIAPDVDVDVEVGDDEVELCDAELYANADTGNLICRTCGTHHDIASRRGFLLREAKDYLVSATEAARALLAWTDYDGSEKKLVDRISKWRDRDKLTVADVTSLNGRDRHLYRLGDIQALMIHDARVHQDRSLRTA